MINDNGRHMTSELTLYEPCAQGFYFLGDC